MSRPVVQGVQMHFLTKGFGCMVRSTKGYSKKTSVFNDFYNEYFRENWSDIYTGLNLPSRSCALLNKYSKKNAHLGSVLAENGAIKLELCNKSKEIELLCYKIVNSHRLPKPERDEFGLSSYYLLDATSVLPVLALDIEPNHFILDMCAGPGGKSFTMVQLLSSDGTLVANEPNRTRRKRLQKVLAGCTVANPTSPKVHVSGIDGIKMGNVETNLYDRVLAGCTVAHPTSPKVHVCGIDGIKMGNVESNLYDRVLVDVPCSADRHGVLTNFTNSSWSVSKSKAFSVLQFQLLKAALLAVVPQGIVVYSTCTLSPFENDDVIEQLLSCGYVEEVRDPFDWINTDEFMLMKNTKYGVLVVPNVEKNWGPLFLCKLRKLAR